MVNALPRLFLARHGDTAWTESRQHTGLTDIPLNERGESKARELGERLRKFNFARVFTSPLQRASRTCELAGFGTMAEVDPDLVEWDYGRYEGMLTHDILKEQSTWDLFRDGCPAGESPDDVVARADRFLAKVNNQPGEILAFASGHIIRMIAARWLHLPPYAGRAFYCRPASISILGYEHERREDPIIELWNLTSAQWK